MSADRAARFLEHLTARRSSLREEIEDDLSSVRGLSLEERGKLLESVCRDAMAILRGRPDFERAIQHQDQRSAESMATWLRLVRQYRADGRH